MGAARQSIGFSPTGEVDGFTNRLSPRGQRLDYLWRFFRCSNYDGWKYDWDGSENVGEVEHDNIATSGAIPPGFEDPGFSTSAVPLKFRKPSAPYYLARVVVNRFTSLLFSSRRHPKLACDDPITEDWLNGFVEATRLWAKMIEARNFGGAMGSVGLGARFVRGKPVVEVYDPRWCNPEFSDRSLLTVKKLEVRYQYVEPVRNAEGEWEDVWFWYRRVIDAKLDTTWARVLVRDGSEPNWAREVCTEEPHGFDTCPVVWVQNMPVQDDIDGDADCHGVYELILRIDRLLSQADKATIANCDPTKVLSSDAEFTEIATGSRNTIQTEQGGTMKYLETTGTSVKAAVELAEKFEEKALTVSRCMLDRNEGGPSRAPEEVDHNYSSMTEQADIFREQYGNAVVTLLEMVLRAARLLDKPQREEDSAGLPRIVRRVIQLPKRRLKDEQTGKSSWVERKLGTGEQIELRWPDYYTKSEATVSAKVDAAGKAKTFGIMDRKHAVEYIAADFQVENVPEVLAQIEAEESAAMGFEPENDMAEKVTQRTEVGAKSALPNPTAKLLPTNV